MSERAVLSGPFPIHESDIAPLNTLFSESFSERYRRDGLLGVRVPPLAHPVWQFSIADAADGAMLWRDGAGEIAAFNLAHRSGAEGWMGPLAVRTDLQGRGIGRAIVGAGVNWLRRAGARVIGLETMPRTVDNIGFYSRLGFVPGPLTVTFSLDAADGPPVAGLSVRTRAEQARIVAECAALADRALPGYDYSREMRLTQAFGLGDTLLLEDGGRVRGFAICHSAPLVEHRAAEEVRVLKVVLDDAAAFGRMLAAIAAFARGAGLERAAVRIPGSSRAAYRAAVAAGARIRWTDLRMTLDGYPEPTPSGGLVLSNWEI